MKNLKFLLYALLCFSIGSVKSQTNLHVFTFEASPNGSLTYSLTGDTLFGMTELGNALAPGSIFSIVPNGTPPNYEYTNLTTFGGINGDSPSGNIIVSPSGKTLYGMTSYGGSNSLGNIFSFDIASLTVGSVYTFSHSSGSLPFGSLTLDNSSGGIVLYGMTTSDASGYGGIFSYNLATSTYTHLHDFTSSEGEPSLNSMILINDTLYGMNYGGLSSGSGFIFYYDLIMGTYNHLYDFSGTDGASPTGDLSYAGNGTFYGMTSSGGVPNAGVIFSYNEYSNIETVLYPFSPTSGGRDPQGSLSISGGTLFGMTNSGGANGYGTIFSFDTYSNTYTDLADFNGTNGQYPYGNLTLSNNVMYGMTISGGNPTSPGNGNVFKFSTCDLGAYTGTTNILCNIGAGVTVTPTYGVYPYTYLWSFGGTNETETVLSAGTYSVLVEDNNGCAAAASVNVMPEIFVNINHTCPGGPGTGEADASVTGGTSPYTYLWSPGGGTTLEITGVGLGTYSLTVTDNNGCSVTSSIVPCGHRPSRYEQQADSIIQLATDISLYPNPSNGQFNITGLQSGMYIEVYDYTGRLVRNTAASTGNMQVNLSDQPNGIYLIRMMSADGTLVKQTKIVKVE